MAKEIDVLRSEARKLMNRVSEMEAKERAEKNRARIGKTFRYRNSYGSGSEWWLYRRIISVGEYGEVITTSFEEKSDGEMCITPHDQRFGESTLGDPISETEYTEALAAFKRKVAQVEAEQ